MILNILPLWTLFLIANIDLIYSDLAYGYDGDDISFAMINISYIDPKTGVRHTHNEEVGKYSMGKIGSVSGIVVHVTSNNGKAHDACDPIDTNNWPSENWIALAMYGNCSDTFKLKNIQETNASAAVIYDNREGSRSIKFQALREFTFIIIFIYLNNTIESSVVLKGANWQKIFCLKFNYCLFRIIIKQKVTISVFSFLYVYMNTAFLSSVLT